MLVMTTDFAVTTVHVIFQFGIIDRKTSQEWAAEQCNPRKPIEDIVHLPKHQGIQEKHDSNYYFCIMDHRKLSQDKFSDMRNPHISNNGFANKRNLQISKNVPCRPPINQSEKEKHDLDKQLDQKNKK
ncbi:hypothetical protein ACI65C_002320 [Semiaphis heraclei]